jgi:hypothetical protein
MHNLEIAILNQRQEAFWESQRSRMSVLLASRHFRNWARRQFGEHSRTRHSKAVFLAEPSFEAQLFREADNFAAASQCCRMKMFALEQRRKAKDGRGRRQIIASFASQENHLPLKTKELWRLFFGYLSKALLNPTQVEAGYRYDGQNGPITITFTNFQKRVSELSPRRAGKRLLIAANNVAIGN